MKSASQSTIILSAAESNFLQAEAIVYGFLTGDPKAAYEAGVQASFTYLGAGDATAYLSSGDPNTDWSTAAGNPTAEIALIIRQKWVAENGIAPLEAYNDYRRLHLPADIPLSTSPYVTPAGSGVPVRTLYPVSEYTTNAANVNAQGTINYFTSKVFWNQ